MLSVVVPIYNEEENITAFHATVRAVLEALKQSWEIVYVNDGSRDSSLSLLTEIQQRDPRVTVVEFSRNFGHQAALTAGLQVARGDAVILMDGDFQDPPEVLPRMVQAWKEGAKVVIAERSSRAEKGIRGKMFPLFYKIMGLISDFPIPLNAGIFGLLDRQAANAIINLQESNRYLPGLRAWVGFPTSIVYYQRADRAAGEPKQTLLKLFKYAMDAIFSFSYKPLRLGMALGGMVMAFSLLLAVIAVGNTMFHLKFFGVIPGSGHIGTLLAILFLGSVQLICMGLIGEYIGRIYDEVRRRPLYLVHKLHRSESEVVLRYKTDKVLAEVEDSVA
ncbi:MAG TPA: glycosyltransferase family 2 protein [Verrucomicrobiae bacterium]|jgi:glycosyltransferase involved in cell wall biosynthesis|nr:glycosyltransferase family 2 protein [Verrucomicrobiae bacterium]